MVNYSNREVLMRIVLVVGASGTGKDSLLRIGRQHFQHHPDIVFIRRYITRPPDGHEDNYYLDTTAFSCLQQQNFFLSHWQAHGNHYGIGHHQIQDHALSICSVSRTVIKDIEKQFPGRVTVLEVTLPAEILRTRLHQRGREDEAGINKRLVRAEIHTTAGRLIRFDNSDPLESTGPKFTRLLTLLKTE